MKNKFLPFIELKNYLLKFTVVVNFIFFGSGFCFGQFEEDVPKESYGVEHKEAPYSLSGTQFTEDGFTIKGNKQEKKLVKKQKKYSLTPKEKAIKLRKESGDTLNFVEEIRYKKISRKEKKFEKLKGEFTTDSATSKVSWSPVKKRSFNPFALFKISKKKKPSEASDATRGENKNKTKEQKKLDRWNKKFNLDSTETSIKGKAESGFPLSPLQVHVYKKALRKEYKLKKKTDKLYKKALLNIQADNTKKMMKKSAKKAKKRDNKRSRKLFFKKVWRSVSFWN